MNLATMTLFDATTDGQMLAQTVDIDAEMGLFQERGIGIRRRGQVFERDAIIFPRGASRLEIRAKGAKQTFQISSAQTFFVPSRVALDVSATSALHDVLVLLPNAQFMRQAITENGLSAKDAQLLQTSCLKLKRSRWLDDLIERYFFERTKNDASPTGCGFFLEKQMMNELVRLIFPDKLKSHGDVLGEEKDDVVVRSLHFIEAHLFDDFSLDDVSDAAKITPSTLLRAFKKTFATTPGNYVKARRLDEAALLIDRGDFQIGDVGTLVGYGDLSAFARSFKARFGVSPSAYRDRVQPDLHKVTTR